MQIYSHSRISCFEQCPLKYKLNYIDKIEAKTEVTIESFLGIRVHETLEKLYKDLQNQKKNDLEDLIEFYNQEWGKNWNNSIVITKKEYTEKNYKKKGHKYIADFFKRYKPFNQEKTIGLEKRIILNLDESGNYKLQGYIDRLTETKDGFYEIHDYKTSAYLPNQKELDNDRQLALYTIGIYDNFSDCKDIDLVWHYLAFDKEMRSKRTKKALKKIKKTTIKLIDVIEQTNTFPSNPSYLCEWCEYKPICREWAHLYKLEGKSANIYLDDPGVKLVNAYTKIQRKKRNINDEIDNQLSQIKEAIINFAKKENVDVIFGSNNKVKIGVSKRYVCPSKNSKEREKLEQLLIKHGKWDEVAQLDINAINRIIQNNEWEKKLIEALKDYVKLEESKRLYLSNIKTD